MMTMASPPHKSKGRVFCREVHGSLITPSYGLEPSVFVQPKSSLTGICFRYSLISFYHYYYYYFVFWGPHAWHMRVPRLALCHDGSSLDSIFFLCSTMIERDKNKDETKQQHIRLIQIKRKMWPILKEEDNCCQAQDYPVINFFKDL